MAKHQYLTFLMVVLMQFALGQNENKSPTIPLDNEIQIHITSIDSTTLSRYIVYNFEYQTNPKTKMASFWAAKYDQRFKLGMAKVVLCRIIQMKEILNGEAFVLRGCHFYNGYSIINGDSIIQQYIFNEFSEHPTLRLCTTDK